MSRKFFITLNFTYTEPINSEKIIDSKLIEFKNVKDASDFKQSLKSFLKHQNNPLYVNNPVSNVYKILTEKLIDPQNKFQGIEIIDKCDILVQTIGKIN